MIVAKDELKKMYGKSLVPVSGKDPRQFAKINEAPFRSNSYNMQKIMEGITFEEKDDDSVIITKQLRANPKFHTLLGLN